MSGGSPPGLGGGAGTFEPPGDGQGHDQAQGHRDACGNGRNQYGTVREGVVQGLLGHGPDNWSLAMSHPIVFMFRLVGVKLNLALIYSGLHPEPTRPPEAPCGATPHKPQHKGRRPRRAQTRCTTKIETNVNPPSL